MINPTFAAERAEARSAIADLVHGYARAIRRGEAASCPALFTQDGSFEVREGDPRHPGAMRRTSLAEGRQAVGAHLARSTSQVRMLPMIHNLMIELDGDIASATSLMVGRIWPSDVEVTGEYTDRFRCVDGRWLFSSRVYTMYRVAETSDAS